MKIFLSWSGDASKAVATALREWLPLVLRDADPWLSHTDIAAGERWSVEVAKELEASNFGIICLTKDNLTAPWILFEAGAVAKRMIEGAVVPYLYGVEFSDITGPLSQFQGKKADKESTLAIVQAINAKGEKPEDVVLLSKRFDLAWPDLEQRLSGVKAANVRRQSPVRAQGEILEEIVTVMRALDKRVSLVEVALKNLVLEPQVEPGAAGDATQSSMDELGPSRGVVASNVGVLVRHQRVTRNITVKQLAAAAHINPTTLIRIEDEQIKRPSLNVISRIANGLGVPIGAFLAEVDDEAGLADNTR